MSSFARGWVIALVVVGACGAPARPAVVGSAGNRGAEPEERADNAPGEIAFDPDHVSCTPDRVAAPSLPSGECTVGTSTYVAVHRRLQERLPELAAGCEGGGEIVLRFALDVEGRVESSEIVRSTAGAASADLALSLIRSVRHCPPGGGQRVVITYPLVLR